jgi:hypothetical protein
VGVDSYILSGEVSGGGGGGSPGGVAGDYQINNGAGGFAAGSLNQPSDGLALLIPSSSTTPGAFSIQDNAQDAFASSIVAADGSSVEIVMLDNLGNAISMTTPTGVSSTAGIYDNGVRQFLGVFTVSALPSGTHPGDTAAVSDATTPALGDAPVGSGAKFCRVIWTGTIWVCG